MARLLRLYMRTLDSYPLVTQALSAGCLMATGDTIAQFGVQRKSFRQFEFERTCRFFIFGTLAVGPVLKGWYGILDRVVKTGTPTTMALKKMAMDQSLFAPMFTGFFLGSMGYWKSKNVQVTVQRVKQDYWTVLMANYKLWPAAQIINFYFMPLQYRVIYVQCVAIIWNTYLAYKVEQTQELEEESEVKVQEVTVQEESYTTS